MRVVSRDPLRRIVVASLRDAVPMNARVMSALFPKQELVETTQ